MASNAISATTIIREEVDGTSSQASLHIRQTRQDITKIPDSTSPAIAVVSWIIIYYLPTYFQVKWTLTGVNR